MPRLAAGLGLQGGERGELRLLPAGCIDCAIVSGRFRGIGIDGGGNRHRDGVGSLNGDSGGDRVGGLGRIGRGGIAGGVFGGVGGGFLAIAAAFRVL